MNSFKVYHVKMKLKMRIIIETERFFSLRNFLRNVSFERLSFSTTLKFFIFKNRKNWKNRLHCLQLSFVNPLT
jgi:hypothetical protein